MQSWIYEHFPSISSSISVEDYHERKPHVCHWKSGKTLPVLTYSKRLDRLTSDVVCWISYNNHRVFKEFELISLFFQTCLMRSIYCHTPTREGCATV